MSLNFGGKETRDENNIVVCDVTESWCLIYVMCWLILNGLGVVWKCVCHQKHSKHKQLQTRLQNLLYSSSAESQPAVAEVLDYFMKRLGSPQSSTRKLASNVSMWLISYNDNTIVTIVTCPWSCRLQHVKFDVSN